MTTAEDNRQRFGQANVYQRSGENRRKRKIGQTKRIGKIQIQIYLPSSKDQKAQENRGTHPKDEVQFRVGRASAVWH